MIEVKKHKFLNCSIDSKKSGDYIRFRKSIKGQKPFSRTVGKTSEPITDLIASYNDILKLFNRAEKTNTVGWLAKLYLKHLKSIVSKNAKKGHITLDTYSGYIRGSKVLEHVFKADGSEITLSDVRLIHVDKPMVNSIKSRRLKILQDDNKIGTGTINQELSFLTSMFDWGCNNVSNLEVKNSPLIGLERLHVEGRQRVVSDEDYKIQYNLATDVMQCIFEVAYLTACRSVEIRNLKDSDIVENKLYLDRKKGSKANWVRISDRLRASLDRAKLLRPKKQITRLHEDKWLFTTRAGDKMKRATITRAMWRLKEKMKNEGFGDVYWTMHMLKHKGMTDAKDKDVAGLSETTKRIYDHSKPTNDPVR